MDVLSPIIGESAAEVVLVVLIVLLVAALIVVITWLLQRIGGRRFGLLGSRSRAPRLGVVDAMPIDSRRRLVLVRRDNVEHLLLIGGGADLVIEQAIQRTAATAQRGRQPAAPGAQRDSLPTAMPAATPPPPPPRPGTPAAEGPPRPAQAAPRPAPRIPPPPAIGPTPLPPAPSRQAPPPPPAPSRPEQATPMPLRPMIEDARRETPANDVRDFVDEAAWPFERGDLPPETRGPVAANGGGLSDMAPGEDDERPRGPAVDHEMARLLGEISGRS
jgi:hypothetical protein